MSTSRSCGRDEVIAADVPIVLVGEALEVHHGDGLVDQQMFTLAIKARPADIPTSLEVDISELTIGAQLRISDLTMPAGVTTEIDPETAIAIGQPPRVVTLEAEGEEGEEGADARRRLRLPKRPATRAKPCAASSPAPSDGAPRPTCWWSGWEIPDANSQGRSTTSGPKRSSCSPPEPAPRCGPKRASRPGSR